MTVHRSALATIAQAPYNYFESIDLDAKRLFKNAGLDPEKIYDANARFPVYATNRLLQIGIHETGDECIVYRVVDFIEPQMLHAMGYSWMASSTLKEALTRFVRYHKMMSTNIEVKLEQAQGSWQLLGKLIDTGQREANEGVMPFCLKICRKSFGDDLRPLHVQLMRKKPVDSTIIEGFYGCAVEFGGSENVLTFSASDITRSLKGANPQVAFAMEEVIARYVVQFDANDVATQVRGIVAKLLVYGEPSRDQIASELNLAPRTLQRRLQEQESSVKEIVDATRHQLSVDFLRSGSYSVKEVAYNLGFSDPSNFARAFKRWEGVSPKEFS
jgi:AraC-like DNA-binding protein